MNRRGFTFVELMTVISIIGLLASIALPKYQALRQRAIAAEIVVNVRTLRLGAFQYNESSGGWPATTPLGMVPTGVEPYLPGDGSTVLRGPNYAIGWSSTSDPTSNAPIQMIQVALTNGTLCVAAYGLLGGASNADVLASCGATGGNVFVTVDR